MFARHSRNGESEEEREREREGPREGLKEEKQIHFIMGERESERAQHQGCSQISLVSN